jgi:hypothetical protein
LIGVSGRRNKCRSVILFPDLGALRAERKAGEMLKDMADKGERDKGQGGDRKSPYQPDRVILADLDIRWPQSSRWQQIAAVPEKADSPEM